MSVCLQMMRKALLSERRDSYQHEPTTLCRPMIEIDDVKWNEIGILHTPYVDSVPPQPTAGSPEDFYIAMDAAYLSGIKGLEQFRYIYILFLFHRLQPNKESLQVQLPWLSGSIGVFASKAPQRPNPIGLSVAKILRTESNKIFLESVDVFDGTPVLDIKPYMRQLDAKDDSNNGWMTEQVMKKIKHHSQK